MRVGVLVTGDTAVRAAHSLTGHHGIDEVVVVVTAHSRSFRVVPDASGCDLLVGSGPEAPDRAAGLGRGLVWDGVTPEPGVEVWGGSPVGLALAIASREPDTRLAAVAFPDYAEANQHEVRFPHPVGSVKTTETVYEGKRVMVGKSDSRFAACLVVAAHRSVAVVDEAPFLAGVALAAAVLTAGDGPHPVWERGLPYLEAAHAMGLVLADNR